MSAVTEMPHVVVVGAGFGGIAATDELSKEGFRVTLIDRFPYNTFQPLLYQVATGGLNPGDVTYALRYFAARHEGVRFRCAGVVAIDHDQQEVVCDDGVRVGFDYLVIGNGITTNHFGIPGAERVHHVDVHPGGGAQGPRHDLRQPGDHRRHVRSEHQRLHSRDRRRRTQPAWRWLASSPSSRPRPFRRSIPNSIRRESMWCSSRWVNISGAV